MRAAAFFMALCIGFDIRTPEHAAEVAKRADGAVEWSALIDKIVKAASPAEAVK